MAEHSPLSPGGSLHRLCCVKGSAADTADHMSCVDRSAVTGVFLSQHISMAAGPDLAAACQPEHRQSWPQRQPSGNTLQQAQTKIFVTSANEGGEALFYCLSS